MALDADTGKVVWEYKFNIFQSDVPPHRIGWASPAADPETGNIYALSGGAQVDRAQPRRQAAVGAVVRRRVRRVHDARRPDDVAARRRRSGDRQRGGVELGHAGGARAPLHRARQAHRRHRLRRRIPGGRPVRHGLRVAAHRHDQRHAPADRRPRRRRRSTPSSRRPARRSGASSPPSAPSTPASSSSGNTVFVSHGDENLDRQRARPDRGDRRLADRRHQDDEVGGQGRPSSASRRRSSTARASIRSTTARRCRPTTSRRGKELWTQPLGTAQKAPPVLADGKIYVGTDSGKFFIVRPQRRPRRDPERGGAAEQHEQLLRLGGHAGADPRRRGDLARPHLLRVERRGLRDRPAAARRRRPASPSTSRRVTRRGRAGAPAGRRRPSWC